MREEDGVAPHCRLQGLDRPVGRVAEVGHRRLAALAGLALSEGACAVMSGPKKGRAWLEDFSPSPGNAKWLIQISNRAQGWRHNRGEARKALRES